jgi:hypothetical protein
MIHDFKAFHEVIERDSEIAFENLTKEDSGYNRRVFIKTYYSYLDGLLHSLRQFALEHKSLTTAERAILGEESYVVSNYQIKTKHNAFLTFEQSFRLSLRYFFGESYDASEVDYGDGGWKNLIDGHSIRNRITHPKVTSQLDITDEEIEMVKRAKLWSDKLLDDLGRRRHEDHLRKHEEILREIAAIEESTRIHGKGSMRKREVVNCIHGYWIKHNIVVLLGFIGQDEGVEIQLKRYWIHEGRRCVAVDHSDRYYVDIVFPVEFSRDYEDVSGVEAE